MADISAYIRQIEIASRGEEVRDSIVGALNGMNNSIPGSVTDALEDAKESGDFDGADGNGIKSIVMNQDYTLTITMDDDSTYTTTSIRGQTGAAGSTGPKGDTGPAGPGGVSPVVTVTAITGGHRLTITDEDHPSGQSFDILDGADGIDGSDGAAGSDGADGISPTVTIAAITGGHRVTITDADHPSGQSFDVMDGSGGGSGGGSGDMTAAIYDPDNDVAAAGGIPAYVEDHAQGALTFDEAPQANSTNPVRSRGIYSALGDCQTKLWKTTLPLAAAGWSNSDPYYQEVSISGVTANSLIDIQPTAAALTQLQTDGVTAIWVENDSGTVKVYAKGAKPTAALTLQATVTEVSNTPFPSYSYNKWIDSVQLNADYTLTINFTNGTSYTTGSIRGATGETGSAGPTGQTGPAGNDGVSPAVTIAQVTGGHTVTITDADHPSGQTFTVLDGGGSGDMQVSVYDSDSAVANAGGIKAYVEDELDNIDAGGLFIAAYGKSTYAQVLDAYKKGKIVYCRASSGSNPASGSQTRMAFMAYVNNEETPTEIEFQYYRSVSSHSASQQGDQVFVYKLSSNSGWSVITREASTKIAVGSGLTTSYSNGTLTISLA